MGDEWTAFSAQTWPCSTRGSSFVIGEQIGQSLGLFQSHLPVCFRSYNVDCNSAHLHFSLNDRLYESQSAQTISNAINQPAGLAQVGLPSLSPDGGHYAPVNLAMNAS